VRDPAAADQRGRLHPALRAAREHLGAAGGDRRPVRGGGGLADLPAIGRDGAPRPARLRDRMKLALAVLLALCLPLLLALTNVRLMATSPAFYEWGFRRHGVGAATGLDDQQLRRVAGEFIAYFQAPPREMDVRVRLRGREVPLFNPREIAHMVDVQALMRTLRRVQLACGAGVLVALVALGLLERRPLGR